MSVRHGGVTIRIPDNAILQDNFKPATITATENGHIAKPPSILPVVFGAGIALFIILNAKNSGFGNFTFNF